MSKPSEFHIGRINEGRGCGSLGWVDNSASSLRNHVGHQYGCLVEVVLHQAPRSFGIPALDCGKNELVMLNRLPGNVGHRQLEMDPILHHTANELGGVR